MHELLIAAGVMGGLGIILASVLAIANRVFYVYEDPRLDEVEEMLPATNCGACGHAGCRAFAEALVKGDDSPSKCTVSPPEMIEAIADYLGVDAGQQEKRVARLACAGGSHVARMRARYKGLQTCRAAHSVAGGGKGCAWGCLGLADCEVVCEFDAIHMDEHGLPVVDEDKCTACGDCVEICPRDLFSIHPKSHRLWVACMNLQRGEEAEAECEVACNACGRCALDAPPGVVTIEDNLAVVHYEYNRLTTPECIQRCPTGAIVWLDDKGRFIKGREARKILRKEPLPIVPD